MRDKTNKEEETGTPGTGDNVRGIDEGMAGLSPQMERGRGEGEGGRERKRERGREREAGIGNAKVESGTVPGSR